MSQTRARQQQEEETNLLRSARVLLANDVHITIRIVWDLNRQHGPLFKMPRRMRAHATQRSCVHAVVRMLMLHARVYTLAQAQRPTGD